MEDSVARIARLKSLIFSLEQGLEHVTELIKHYPCAVLDVTREQDVKLLNKLNDELRALEKTDGRTAM